MSKKKNKYYVVWNGVTPGIYDSWQDCQQQIKGYPDAKYKGFKTKQEAEEAYHSSYQEYYNYDDKKSKEKIRPEDTKNINLDSWSVDGACSGNPGMMEYRGVNTRTGEEIFRVGPLRGGTNNIGEILAIVHALALLDKKGNTTTPVYTDSRTAMSWYKNKKINTKLRRTKENEKIFEMLKRAQAWLVSHHLPNPVLKWDTEKWGEIPADFGRK